MALEIAVHSGVVFEWKTIESATHVTYTSIEFVGGKTIRGVRVTHEMSDILAPFLDNSQALALHVTPPAGSTPALLIAFEAPGGEVFATDIPPLPFLFKLAPRAALIAGILLIPAFGIGLLLLGAWSTMRNNIRPLVEMREYVQRLPRATLIKS